jgi:hypothetical protein
MNFGEIRVLRFERPECGAKAILADLWIDASAELFVVDEQMPVIIDVFGAHGIYREILLSAVIEIGSEVMRGPLASHQGTKRRSVVAAIDSDRATRAHDCGGVFGQRQHRPAAQQPAQPGFIVAGEPPISGMRLVGHGRQPKQVADRPAEPLGFGAPSHKKAATVLDSLSPMIVWDQVRAAEFKMRNGSPKAI